MATSALLLPEMERVGRKQSSRQRARDEGTVTPLGVEIDTRLYEAMGRCRTSKKWSKRTLVEEALRRYLVQEGFSPTEDKEGE